MSATTLQRWQRLEPSGPEPWRKQKHRRLEETRVDLSCPLYHFLFALQRTFLKINICKKTHGRHLCSQIGRRGCQFPAATVTLISLQPEAHNRSYKVLQARAVSLHFSESKCHLLFLACGLSSHPLLLPLAFLPPSHEDPGHYPEDRPLHLPSHRQVRHPLQGNPSQEQN